MKRRKAGTRQGNAVRLVASLTLEGGVIVAETPYHASFVEDLKATIQWSKRAWHQERKAWTVDKDQFDKLVFICEQHFDDVLLLNFPKQDVSDDSYAKLFLLPDAPLELVKAAYKTLALLYHPDRGGSKEKMQQINLAYKEVLGELKNGDD